VARRTGAVLQHIGSAIAMPFVSLELPTLLSQSKLIRSLLIDTQAARDATSILIFHQFAVRFLMRAPEVDYTFAK
tara:strand:+ start:1049 stop:1273 length:225 start_codon:yes stop_codon:yes gene_type:complete